MKKFLLTLACLAVTGVVSSQTNTNNLYLKWTAVTTFASGIAIPSSLPVTYEVWGANQGGTPAQLATGITSTNLTRTNVDVGVMKCYYVMADVKGYVPSLPTSLTCNQVPAAGSIPTGSVPAAPTGFTVTTSP